MDVKYVGPHDGVEVPLPSGLVARCERGGTMSVPDDVAKGLLEQPTNWEPAKGSAKNAEKA